MLHLLTAIALLAAPQAAAGPLHIDDVLSDEGPATDCFVAYWRPNAKPGKSGDIANVLISVGHEATVKIDGTVFLLPHIRGNGRPASPAVYAGANAPTVVETSIVVRAYKNAGESVKSLKGTLKITFRNQTQTLTVKGEDYCYNG